MQTMTCRRATVGPGDSVGAPRYVVAAPAAATVALVVAEISAEYSVYISREW